MITEYHTACVIRGSAVTSPILPRELAERLPPLADYASPENRSGATDVRIRDHWARTLQVAVLCHRLDMALSEEPGSSKSLVRSRHHCGDLLAYFLSPGTTWELHFEDVVTQALKENRRHLEMRRTKAATSLGNCNRCRTELRREFNATSEAMQMVIDQLCDQLYQTPAWLKSHSRDSDSFFGALGFMLPVEEFTLRTASLTNMLDWLAQPQGPHLVDGSSTKNSSMALAILMTPEALYDPHSPMVGLGLMYKAPYIQTTSWTEAYFDLKLASQAEAGSQTTGAKVIFVQIQASSQVIPLPGVPTLFLDVKTPEDITNSKAP